MWRKKNPHALLVGMQTGAATLEKSMEFLKKLKTELPYDPAIVPLSIYPKDTKIQSQRDTCTLMFITVLSTIAEQWKEPRCPSTDEWIKMMWYTYTMAYYSAIKIMKSCHLQNDIDGSRE